MGAFCFLALFTASALLTTSNENKPGDFDLYFESSPGKQIELTMAEIEDINHRNYMTESVLKTEEATESESKSTKEDSLVNIGQQINLSTGIVEKETNRIDNNSETTEATERLLSPQFVYLTQTEKCLRSNLSHSLELYNRSKCRCDVLVLSYREECNEPRPRHFTYLFDNRTTWGTGRNKLFFHATKRNINYIYYIFLDDDISLRFNRQATPAMKKLSPIQVFQNWLLDYAPAVGLVDYEGRNEGKLVHLRKRNVCGRLQAKNRTVANPTIFFDPLFNAIHAKAVGHIYPLDTRYEKKNWWLTDKYLASAVEMKFRGQALLYFPLTVENGLHRPYPRSFFGTIITWKKFIKRIQKQAPDHYKNHRLFKNFRKNPTLYVRRSWTYCMNITRHQEIIPYAHLEKQQPAKGSRIRRKRFY